MTLPILGQALLLLALLAAGYGSVASFIGARRIMRVEPDRLASHQAGRSATGEPLADAGYRILSAAMACALDGTPIPATLKTFQPTAYYPSTLHLLSLSMLRERYPQCL